MNVESNRVARKSLEGGFTLVEASIASCITVLISAASLTCFLWCAEQSTLAVKTSWSQNEAMRTSGKLTDYIRNAASVHGVDQSNKWVELRMTNQTVVRLSYSNGVDNLRDGRLYMQSGTNTETIVARGLTQIMDDVGFTAPMFTLSPDSNVLRVAYRVSEPASTGGRDADDGDYAVCVRFGVYLRNLAQ